MPYYPYGFGEDTAGGHQYTIDTWFKHLVSNYTGLSFLELETLNYLKYLTWRRDAYIYFLNRTEAGRTYLDNAWRMEQTNPDREALREKYGRKEGKNNG